MSKRLAVILVGSVGAAISAFPLQRSLCGNVWSAAKHGSTAGIHCFNHPQLPAEFKFALCTKSKSYNQF
jgi:hypothetical protein